MTPKEYQEIVKQKLQRAYPDVDVVTEWSSMKGVPDRYSPRVDVAVGPFAINRRQINSYNTLMETGQRFVNALIEKHNENLQTFGLEPEEDLFERISYFNRNARCFLCIEIENMVSRKHLIGGLVNASALGRIGVVIPWTPEKLKAFLKLRNYLKFLGEVGKNTFKTDNALILTKSQLDQCLRLL